MTSFHVELKKVVDDSYDIEIGYGLEDKLFADLKGGLMGGRKKVAIITDHNVESPYAVPLAWELGENGYDVKIFAFPAGELSKTREMKASIEDEMLKEGYRRDCFVLAMGGGVVTDLAGFVAGTFGRGVPFINYATTVLAAADASIGGKTAVDTPLATNLIGMFYQPKKVYLDLDTWESLPKREISCGMAETIKHACMADGEFFKYLEDHMEEILALEHEPCTHMAERNCQIKYNVVMKDEREKGLREILNLGHTVGRAIETVSDYRLLHGEAVSIGLVAEAHLAWHLGFLKDGEVERIASLLGRAGLPTAIPEYIDREALVKKLYTDKKVRDGKLRFVVQDGIGSIATFGENNFATTVDESSARQIIWEI